jgi:hypothetical protein
MPFVDGKTPRNFFIHSRGDLGGPLLNKRTLLHSFRRGAWMPFVDENILYSSSSFI